MTKATVHNWHRRNLYAASKLPVEIMCCGQNENPSKGGAYFQVRVRSKSKGSLVITMTPTEALSFLRQVQHCTKRFVP